MKTVRRYAPGTSVPVLLADTDAIQGSGAIIDYLDEYFPEFSLTPVDKELQRLSREIEEDMDERLGCPIRQILYFWLLDHPGFIQHCFTHPMPPYKKLVFRITYPVLRKLIYRAYVVSPERVEAARRGFARTLSELAERLQDRQYLVGETFSRADLGVASMLCLIVLPPEHPLPWLDIPDPRTRRFIADYKNHPVSLWVREIYRMHRKPDRAGTTQTGGAK
jgi:glutathione S-transferase